MRLLLVLLVAFVSVKGAAIVVTPDAPPLIQELSDNGEAEYDLQQVRPDTEYELLISYPANRPARFRMTLLDEPPRQRDLLNTEKMVFWTRPGQTSARAHLVAQHDGIPVPARRAEVLSKKIRFTVVLKKRFLGVPISSAPVIAVCAVIVIAGLLYGCWPTITGRKDD